MIDPFVMVFIVKRLLKIIYYRTISEVNVRVLMG